MEISHIISEQVKHSGHCNSFNVCLISLKSHLIHKQLIYLAAAQPEFYLLSQRPGHFHQHIYCFPKSIFMSHYPSDWLLLGQVGTQIS